MEIDYGHETGDVRNDIYLLGADGQGGFSARIVNNKELTNELVGPGANSRPRLVQNLTNFCLVAATVLFRSLRQRNKLEKVKS